MATTAQAAENASANKPYLGWSSWSLQATTAPGYGKHWLSAEQVLAQADGMHALLQSHGYRYVNIDSGWSKGFDAFGRPIANPRTFPDGIAPLAQHLHANGQKLGLYWVPGVSDALLRQNPPIAGTSFHIADIVAQPHRPGSAFRFGLAIDFAKPGAQAYIDSIAQQFADWGVDFLKLDGNVPGSDYKQHDVDTRPDVAAWAAALRKTGRPIWFTLSWHLDRRDAATWQKTANAWRINDDVERYGLTLTGWQQIAKRLEQQPAWQNEIGPTKGWPDLDSLDIANGPLDGLSTDEKQLAMTFWAISCSPLYVGGDLTKLDPAGLALLTNDEVIAIDQAGQPATLIVPGRQPVWRINRPGGAAVLGLFNLDDQPRPITLNWKSLGLRSPVRVRDLWQHRDLEATSDQFDARLRPHACQLLLVTLR